MASLFTRVRHLPKNLIGFQCRTMASPRKRFYKNVDVVSAGGIFEITLDSKKLKTPGGSVLTIDNESLALAVAQEWQAQEGIIQMSQMHLTGLCSTCLDNPTKVTKYELVDNIINFMETDTVLYFGQEPHGLMEHQLLEWQPVIEWFCARHNVSIKPSFNMSQVPHFSSDVIDKVRRQILSYNFNAVNGFSFGVDALKSIILMSALVEHKLSVQQAVKLARLELEFQIAKWGNVPWSHDLELYDTTSRLSAAQIFFQCHNSQYMKRTKHAI